MYYIIVIIAIVYFILMFVRILTVRVFYWDANKEPF